MSVPASPDPIIHFDHATFGFPGVIALEDISLEIQAGEFVGVIGPNGSGKTTLCRAVLGLMAPLKGHLRIFDCACDELRCHHRAKIGYLPQKGVVDRNFPVTVLETVMMGRYGSIGSVHAAIRERSQDRAGRPGSCGDGGASRQRAGPPLWRTAAAGLHRQSVGPATTSIVARRADDWTGYHDPAQCRRVGAASARRVRLDSPLDHP